MIVLSMLLVVVGLVALLLGVFGVSDEPLQFVYGSIAACLIAAVLLVLGVLRGRPSRKPLVTGGGQDASWAGASAWTTDPSREGPLSRDEPDARTAASGADIPPVEVVGSAGPADGPRDAAVGSGDGPRDAAAELDVVLAQVEGVGADERAVLHERFGSVAALRAAGAEGIAAAPGIDPALAERIAAQVGAWGT